MVDETWKNNGDAVHKGGPKSGKYLIEESTNNWERRHYVDTGNILAESS